MGLDSTSPLGSRECVPWRIAVLSPNALLVQIRNITYSRCRGFELASGAKCGIHRFADFHQPIDPYSLFAIR
jgi:hypothetical protein